MRRSTYLIFINAMILIVVFALLAQSLFIIKRLAQAETVTGKVLVQHSGKGDFTPLSAGEFIKTDDVVKTGADGKAEFKWADGTRLNILPDSDLVVRKANYNMAKKSDESQFRLNNGTIFVRIMKSLAPQSKFEVETPTAVAAVRGTIFMVRVQNGRTQVAVHKGSVKVSSGEGDDAHEALIMPGRVATSSAAGEVQTSADTEADAEFTEHTDITKPELTARILPLRDNRAIVQGRAEAGDTVTVNGKEIEVLGSGAFFYRVKLTPGLNSFVIVARDKHNESAQITKTYTLP